MCEALDGRWYFTGDNACTDEAGDIERVREGVALGGLPNLWKPARDAYVRVMAIPLLGTGKTDLQAVKRIAMESRVSG